MEEITNELDLDFAPIDAKRFNELVLTVRQLLTDYTQAGIDFENASSRHMAASQAYFTAVTELNQFVQHATQMPMQDADGNKYESKFL